MTSLSELGPAPALTRGSRRSSVIAAEREAYARHLDTLPETVWAWLGGWTSADGSILSAGPNRRPRIRFVITDRDPLDTMAALFGNAVGGPIPASGLGVKDRFHWQMSGWPAQALIARIKPWLSERYQERADALSAWQPNTDSGHKLTASDVSAIKRALSGGETGRSLAHTYGVSEAMIGHIKTGRAWSDVEPQLGKQAA